MSDKEIWSFVNSAFADLKAKSLIPPDIELIDYAVSSTGLVVYLILSDALWLGITNPASLDQHISELHRGNYQ